MKLYYFKAESGNFGDDLNLWLWPKLLPTNFFDDDASTIFVGIGTLLNHRIPAANKTVVFGAGHGYGTKPILDSTWDIFCVRGPKTALELGLSPAYAITDPAILIYEFTRKAIFPISGRVGLLMHCDSVAYGQWDQLAKEAGLYFIDPRWDVDRVIRELGSCERIITEAMHGAIFADAMRIPWTPIIAYPHISLFKWQDWTASLELKFEPNMIQSNWRGDVGLPIGHTLKNKTKRLINKFGILDKNWTAPLPARSSRRDWDKTVLNLHQVKTKIAPTLSDCLIHTLRVEELHGRLNSMLIKYGY